MKMRFWSGLTAIVACLVLGSLASAATTITWGGTSVNMDFVTVGNPGNAADDTAYGAVGYTYRIGTYEVSETQWDAVSAASSTDLLDNSGRWSGNQPVAAISWHEAAMFCNWLTSGDVTEGYYSISGGVATPNALSHDAYAAIHGTTYFLPTEDEWYKAAYYDPNKAGGAGYWDYPTASDTAPTPVPNGTSAGTAVFNQSWEQGPADISAAGGLSAYGTMGQGGNVWEWNETAISLWRGVRGGSFVNSSFNHLASSGRYGDNPTVEDYDVGFRVASSSVGAVPEPGSLIIWACGGLGALLLRRRRK